MHGKLLYIQHELMVSRFHAMLELGCRKVCRQSCTSSNGSRARNSGSA